MFGTVPGKRDLLIQENQFGTCPSMDHSSYSDESGSLTNSGPPFSTPSPQLDRWRTTSETGTTFSTLDLSQPKQYNSINATAHTTRLAVCVQSASDHQLHTGSKSRTSDSQQDPTKNLVFSSRCQSLINFDTDSILKSSYNIIATKQQGFKSTGRTELLERGSFLNPDFEGHKETKLLDNNNNNKSFSSDDWQDLDKTQNSKQSLILNPLPRKSSYLKWRFSKSREPPETALDIAFRTMLDYKQPITLHRPSKADRQMGHYDYLPSIKVISSKDQRRRDAMRSQLKEQLLLAEERKRQEILEMESELILDEDREEALQKNIFLPSGEEYEFSEGNILAATLPVSSPKQASSCQSSGNVPTVGTSNSPRNSLYDGRRKSDVSHDGRRFSNAHHDGQRPTCSNVSLNVNGVAFSHNSPSPSIRGSKRWHSISTIVRREKMFQVVSHWPGLQKPPNIFQAPLEPPNEDDDTLEEELTPPSVHYNRRRQSTVPNSKTTQKRTQSLSKGLLWMRTKCHHSSGTMDRQCRAASWFL